jgi:polyphosphate glucokinase
MNADDSVDNGTNSLGDNESALAEVVAADSEATAATVDNGPYTLGIDIGGTGIKMMVLNAEGQSISERLRESTPQPAQPAPMLEVMRAMVAKLPAYDRISVGFPGVVHTGVVRTAPNLDPAWHGYDLVQALETAFGKPTRVANDADVQGYGVIEGKGVELVLTLGTGLGAALFTDGVLVPNLELGHHPFRKGQTYEEQLGKPALEKVGKKRWNRRLKKAIELLDRIVNYRMLYLGGGHANFVTLKLPDNVQIVNNDAGILGGIALWRR